MLTSAKVDLKKYLFYVLFLLICSSFFLKSIPEFLIVLLVVVATSVNHWMLIFVTRTLSESAATGISKNKYLVGPMTIGKLFLIFGALSFGVQIMEKRIIIPVLIYVLQILVLYLSLNRKELNK